MPFRTKHSYSTSSGTTVIGRKGAKTSTASRPPAGTKKIKPPTAATVPTVTTSPSGHVTTSNFPSPRAARVARKQASSSRRRVRRIERQQASALGFHRRSQERAAALTPHVPGSHARLASLGAMREPVRLTPRKPAPSYKPPKFQGAKTAGTPSLKELQVADKQGTIRRNKAGYVTTPAVRRVSSSLKRLQAKARQSSGPLPGLGSEESQVARKVLRTGRKEGATRKQKLAAAETGLVESGFQNLAGGDADSEGWRQERTSIYGTGPTGPRNVKAGAQRFFSEAKEQGGATAGELAANVQRPAEQYRGRYDEVKPEANAILKAAEHGGLKPAQQRKLAVTKRKALNLGLAVGKSANVKHADYLKLFGKQVARELHLVKGGQYEKGPGKLVVGSSDVYYGHEPEIAARLKLLSAKLGKPIYIISAHRTPQHSVEVGGFSNDPHTEGKAADIGVGSALRDSAGTITEAQYESVGLHRPYYPESAAEINHVELLNGGTPATGGGSSGSVVTGGSTALPSGAVASYAAATGQSPKVVRERLKRGKLWPQQILKKLKELGAGLGEGSQKPASATEDKGAILAELEQRYGAKAA